MGSPIIPGGSFFSAHIHMTGSDNGNSLEMREENFGSLKPGATIRDMHSHYDQPTGASKCWKVRILNFDRK